MSRDSEWGSLIRGAGINAQKKTFQELMGLIDRDYIEQIFEEGFKIEAFNPNNNRNVVRWVWKGKTYELSRFER